MITTPQDDLNEAAINFVAEEITLEQAHGECDLRETCERCPNCTGTANGCEIVDRHERAHAALHAAVERFVAWLSIPRPAVPEIVPSGVWVGRDE